MDGMTKANLQLPLAAQIGLNAALQGKFNFIAFTTKKLPADVQAFYTKDRMRAAGWPAKRHPLERRTIWRRCPASN